MNDRSAANRLKARCCIAGGGPAGMLLGFLLARAGVETIVLEKHADFLRDFRGDTVHPSTMEVMSELGLLQGLLALPHQKLKRLRAEIGGQLITMADFSRLPVPAPYVALMPQWDFLDFLADHAKRYPTFRLMMRTEATRLLRRDGRIIGVHATGPDGEVEIEAELVVGADGRSSTMRADANMEVEDLGAPMDVLWMRLPRRPSDPDTVGRIEPGYLLATLDRGDYWQCAIVIPKGSAEEVKARGIEAFRKTVADIAPFLGDRVAELKSFDDVKLLTVLVDRLKQWWAPGLLCIGDAAHAMSPIGGVGINLAVQDAVAAANILAQPLRRGLVTTDDLAAVQRRREFPTRVIQRIQLLIQNRVIRSVLGARAPIAPPAIIRTIDRFPILQRIPARILGLGVRREHVRTPELTKPA